MATATESKHTPGPWRLGKYDKITTADGETLHVHGVAIPMAGYEGRDAEFKANARLIAAAPAMLKALKRAADAMDNLSRNETRFIQAKLGAKDAIRDAEGE